MRSIAAISLGIALPGLFTLSGRNINWLRISTPILSVSACTPILVYGSLPWVYDLVS